MNVVRDTDAPPQKDPSQLETISQNGEYTIIDPRDDRMATHWIHTDIVRDLWEVR